MKGMYASLRVIICVVALTSLSKGMAQDAAAPLHGSSTDQLRPPALADGGTDARQIGNGMQQERSEGGGADVKPRSLLRAPSLSAAVSSLQVGGHVAANEYTAVITFEDGSGGETVPSPTEDAGRNAYGTVITRGDSSALFIAAQEAIPGAKCFDVYVRTGKDLHYYKQGGCTPVGAIAVLLSTPAISGKQPSSTANARSAIATLVKGLRGPGMVSIPADISTSDVSGDPERNQIIIDSRHATLNASCTDGSPWKTSSYGIVTGCLNLDMAPAALQLGQQAQAASFVVHAEQHPYYGGGLQLSAPPSLIAVTAGAYRDSTRNESIWGELENIAFTGAPRGSLTYGNEVAMFNQSSEDAVTLAGGVGYHAGSLGIHKPMYGAWITASSPADAWRTGIRVEDSSSETGLYIGGGLPIGAEIRSPIVLDQTDGQPLTIRARTNKPSADLQLMDSSGTSVLGEWDANGAIRWGGGRTIASSSDLIQSLGGVTGLIGGARLKTGACTTGAVTVHGATVGEPVAVSATDGSLPDGSITLSVAVTAKDTITVQVCAIITTIPAAKRYNVRVMS